jgi:non-ribosomal peptide synthetase component E (peptide arylation enzyme)
MTLLRNPLAEVFHKNPRMALELAKAVGSRLSCAYVQVHGMDEGLETCTGV